MLELNYASGLEAQDNLARLVRDTKKSNPLRHVTLIVDSNHQALQFRRQLVRSQARGGHTSSLTGFSSLTKYDVVATLARISQVAWNSEDYKTAKQYSLRRVLSTRGKVFENLAHHPESFATLTKYIDQFDWVQLNDRLVLDLISVGESLTTKVSLQLLQIAKEVQDQLRAAGQLSPADVMRRLAGITSYEVLHQMKMRLGQVLVVSGDYPSILSSFLDQLVGSDAQIKITLVRDGSEPREAQVLSFPDPETEAKAVVREVAKRISAGHAIDQFAVLYSDALQYADLLENEFEQAQIAWNGMATESAVLSLPATVLKGYLAVVSSILLTGTFSRADLLGLLRITSITSQGQTFSSGTFFRFLKRHGMFNEVSNWAPLLTAMINQIPALESELQLLADLEAEQEEIDDITFKLQQAKTASSLERLIYELVDSADRLAKSTTGSDLAALAWQEINEFFPQLAKAKMPIDRLAFEMIDQEIGAQHHSVLSSREEIRDSLIQLGEHIILKLSQLKMQHGELSRGVYVGPVSQNGALYFENLWIVGAGEGILPPQISEDPIFPDVLKELFTKETGLNIKTVAARASEIEANFFAAATGANNLWISFPRGGTLLKGEGMPSAWLGSLTSSPIQDVSAAFEFRLGEVGAVSVTDLQAKESAALSVEQADSKQLSAALWFTAPQATMYAGNLEGKLAGPIIDFGQMSLSASSVEKFLKCGHNFFTAKVLGFSDMEEPDSIDEIRPIDFGKAVHSAFERLLKEFPELNPSFGERYSDEAVEKFRRLFNEECDLIVARGQSGWPPLFESRKRAFIDQLDQYFTLEHAARTHVVVESPTKPERWRPFSKANLLRPQNAEFEFDKTGNGLLQVPIQVDGYPVETLRFKGLIDRVDVSVDREHVGVIDFKTGKHSNIDKTSAVQDLLYEYAIRRNTNFLGVTKVSSRYLFLSTSKDGSGVVDLRTDREHGVFLDPIEGGLSGQEYTDALAQNKISAELELEERLKLLVEAAHKGSFLTHDVSASSKSFAFCPTCKKLGKKTITRLSYLAHQNSQPIQDDSEEGSEQ